MRLRKVCPQCNTVVHVKRSVCDCGHAFAAEETREQTLHRQEQNQTHLACAECSVLQCCSFHQQVFAVTVEIFTFEQLLTKLNHMSMHPTLASFPGPTQLSSLKVTGRGPGDKTSVYLQHVDTMVLRHWLQECKVLQFDWMAQFLSLQPDATKTCSWFTYGTLCSCSVHGVKNTCMYSLCEEHREYI